MGTTLSFSSRQMKKLPRPLVGTRTFIRDKEREMRDHEWSDNFGKPLIEALRGPRPAPQLGKLQRFAANVLENLYEKTRTPGSRFWHELAEDERAQLNKFAERVAEHVKNE